MNHIDGCRKQDKINYIQRVGFKPTRNPLNPKIHLTRLTSSSVIRLSRYQWFVVTTTIHPTNQLLLVNNMQLIMETVLTCSARTPD